ncbi:ArgK Putative periplasmic protein kinase ArgK and related GTPases of G3E family [Candidatus Nanopelagicaceae bacterium]
MGTSDGMSEERMETLHAIMQKPSKSDFDIARGISIIEQDQIKISALEPFIEKPITSGVRRIGITGAPGVGKSTFMNKLVSTQNFSNYKVAIIAIDPSSRISKGAVLGDRIRITHNSVFEKIYFRSMATRGAFGGLNSSIESVLFFLANCGFTLIFIETVGVGQNEVQIAECVDSVVHILDSNAGDEVQMEKAGVMEVGDIYFVNTRNDQVNSQFISNLRSFVENSMRESKVKPEVFVGSAVSGEGFEDVTRYLNFSASDEFILDGKK